MLRLTNDTLGMALHIALYQRLLAFCQQYTPEFPAEPIVQNWLTRLYNGDDTLYIVVTLDSAYNITHHSLIEVTENFGYRVVFCHQTMIDKGSTAKLDEVMEYLDKLAEQQEAVCISATVSKNVKVYEKKYGYTQSRVSIVKWKTDM